MTSRSRTFKYFTILPILLCCKMGFGETADLLTISPKPSNCLSKLVHSKDPNSWHQQSHVQKVETLKEIFAFETFFLLEGLLAMNMSNHMGEFQQWLVNQDPQNSENFSTQNIEDILSYHYPGNIYLTALFDLDRRTPLFSTKSKYRLKMRSVIYLRYLFEKFLKDMIQMNGSKVVDRLNYSIHALCVSSYKDRLVYYKFLRFTGSSQYEKLCTFFKTQGEGGFYSSETNKEDPHSGFNALKSLLKQLTWGLELSENFYRLPIEDAIKGYSQKTPEFAALIEMRSQNLAMPLVGQETSGRESLTYIPNTDFSVLLEILESPVNEINLSRLLQEQVVISNHIRKLSTNFSASFKSVRIELDTVSGFLSEDETFKIKNIDKLIAKTRPLPQIVHQYISEIERIEDLLDKVSGYSVAEKLMPETSHSISNSSVEVAVKEVHQASKKQILELKQLILEFFESYNKVNYLFGKKLLEDE